MTKMRNNTLCSNVMLEVELLVDDNGGKVFLFEMENTMAQICHFGKQSIVAQLCSVIAATVAFQVLSNFLWQTFHANILFYLFWI